jgi:DEP domain-containing protein 5
MPEFEMLGLLQYDLVSSIAIPPLQDRPDGNEGPPESPGSVSSNHNTRALEEIEEYRRQFDQDTFTCTPNVAASPLSAHATAIRADSIHAFPLASGRQRGRLLRRTSSSTSLSTKYDNSIPAVESSLASRRSRPTSGHFDDDFRNRLTSFAPSTSPKDRRPVWSTQTEHRHRKSLLGTAEPSSSRRGSTSTQIQPHSHSRGTPSATLTSGPSRSRHNSSAPLPSPLAIEAIPEIPDNTSINSTDTTNSSEKRLGVLQFPLMRFASNIFLTRFRSAAGYPPAEPVSGATAAEASKSGNPEKTLPVSSPQVPQPLPITHTPPRRAHKPREEDSNPAPGQRNSLTRGSPLSGSPLANLPTPPIVMSHLSSTLVTSLPPLVNPAFREPPVLYTQTSLARRWEHLSPTPTYETQIKWKSLCVPGCLPLTVEHLPTEEELAKGFSVHSYETTIGSEMSESFLVKRPVIMRGQAPEEAWAMAIMRVMVALRLAQGFQFVLQKSRIVHAPPQDISLSSTVTAKPSVVHLRKPRGPAEILREADMPVHLSVSDQIHKIQYDPTGPSIRIERFVRRMPVSVPIPYKCLIWPKLGGGYTECHTLFKSQDMELYGWNR